MHENSEKLVEHNKTSFLHELPILKQKSQRRQNKFSRGVKWGGTLELLFHLEKLKESVQKVSVVK